MSNLKLSFKLKGLVGLDSEEDLVIYADTIKELKHKLKELYNIDLDKIDNVHKINKKTRKKKLK